MHDSGALRAAALGHAARGWHVFPLRPDDRRRDRDHAKRPAFPGHGEDRCTRTDPRCRDGHAGWEPRATTDADRIRRAWSSTAYNVGIACGPSRLVVIDLDVRKPGAPAPAGHGGYRHGLQVFGDLCREYGRPVPATYTVDTGSGGRHLYFRHPGGPPLRNTAGGLGWLIDTRAHGGYVVGAGSTAGGLPYEVADDRPVAELPGWIVALLRPIEPVGPRRVLGDFSAFDRGAYVRGAVTRTLDLLGTARAPGRNNALYLAAMTLGQLAAGGHLTEAEVSEALTPTALAIGLTERETSRTIRSGLAAGARNPRRAA